MEITSISSFIISVGVIAILTWAWRMLNWIWIEPQKLEKCLRQQGLNGNSYRLLNGDIKQESDMLREANSTPIDFSHDIAPRVIPFLHDSVQKYGKCNFMWLGPTPRVNIMDIELIKDILSKNIDFKKPDTTPLTKLLVNGLANYNDNQWAKHRKIINPAFHFEKLKLMLPSFDTSCSQLLQEWEKLISRDESCEVDVWPYIQDMTSDVISRTAFGSSYQEGERIFNLLKEQSINIMQLSQSIYIPGWRFLPTKLNKRLKNVDKEIQLLLSGLINKREKAMKIGEAPTDDLLGLLMDSNLKDIKEHGNNDKNVGLSIQEVIEECRLFYIAGQETTADLLVWTMILLSKHQEWQKLARDEVTRMFGNERPNFDGLNHLKIVTMILYEVLRLYPSTAFFRRTVFKETKIGNLYLPAGVQVYIPTVLIHRDQEEWGPEALEFNPGRFSEGVSNATKSQVAFFTFGWGPRICIGQGFAMLEAKMAMSMILQRFSFKISPSYVHAPISVLTLKPQFGAQLMLHKL